MFTITVLKGEGNLKYSCQTLKEAEFAAEVMSNPGWVILLRDEIGDFDRSYFKGEPCK